MGSDARDKLSAREIRDLGDIAGTMIPASATMGMPGADDPAILADIVGSLGRDLALVSAALAAIGERASGGFADLDRDSGEALINAYWAQGGGAMAALGRVVLAAYYRDDRVLRALGLEPRAPFPNGHALEQGDWSLLDAVRARPAFWRDDRSDPGEGR
jgi:hypothetical protein